MIMIIRDVDFIGNRTNAILTNEHCECEMGRAIVTCVTSAHVSSLIAFHCLIFSSKESLIVIPTLLNHIELFV